MIADRPGVSAGVTSVVRNAASERFASNRVKSQSQSSQHSQRQDGQDIHIVFHILLYHVFPAHHGNKNGTNTPRRCRHRGPAS